MSKITVAIQLCSQCRPIVEGEVVKMGAVGRALSEEESHRVVKLVCKKCLKSGGLQRLGHAVH